MATIIDDFAANLTATLDAIASSKIYTDINAMYDEGRLQKDQLDKVIISFHEKALSMAGATSENIAIKGYRLDEIIAKDLAVKSQQIAESEGKLAIEQEQSGKDLEVKSQQIAESEGKLAIEQAQSAKDLEVKGARKLLIDRQRIGFDDNKKIEKAKMLSDAIGMIQSGGNDAPAAFLSSWTTAISSI